MRPLKTTRPRKQRDTCPARPMALAAMPRRITVDLTPQAVEQVAARVAQLLRQEDRSEQPELLTAGELALHLRVQRPWIYKHRHQLGGQRIGNGPRAQWRFDPQTAVEALKRSGSPSMNTGAQTENFSKQGPRQ